MGNCDLLFVFIDISSSDFLSPDHIESVSEVGIKSLCHPGQPWTFPCVEMAMTKAE
jgi:hypothetical protein